MNGMVMAPVSGRLSSSGSDFQSKLPRLSFVAPRPVFKRSAKPTAAINSGFPAVRLSSATPENKVTTSKAKVVKRATERPPIAAKNPPVVQPRKSFGVNKVERPKPALSNDSNEWRRASQVFKQDRRESLAFSNDRRTSSASHDRSKTSLGFGSSQSRLSIYNGNQNTGTRRRDSLAAVVNFVPRKSMYKSRQPRNSVEPATGFARYRRDSLAPFAAPSTPAQAHHMSGQSTPNESMASDQRQRSMKFMATSTPMATPRSQRKANTSGTFSPAKSFLQVPNQSRLDISRGSPAQGQHAQIRASPLNDIGVVVNGRATATDFEEYYSKFSPHNLRTELIALNMRKKAVEKILGRHAAGGLETILESKERERRTLSSGDSRLTKITEKSELSSASTSTPAPVETVGKEENPAQPGDVAPKAENGLVGDLLEKNGRGSFDDAAAGDEPACSNKMEPKDDEVAESDNDEEPEPPIVVPKKTRGRKVRLSVGRRRSLVGNGMKLRPRRKGGKN